MTDTRELLIFDVRGLNFSVPLGSVEEVVPTNVITKVPSSPPFLLGLSAVRGKVVGVIDAAVRFGIPPGLNSFFMVCRVRGNQTAVTIDRPVMAGLLCVRPLEAVEFELLRAAAGIDSKFLSGAFELLEGADEQAPRSTGVKCLEVVPDLFVSEQMAGRIEEAV
jgi:purine-binding chemotaxis protein CheW